VRRLSVPAAEGQPYDVSSSRTKRTTLIPLHGGDLERPLLKMITQQAGMTEDQFIELL
jgi:hypothetical protein